MQEVGVKETHTDRLRFISLLSPLVDVMVSGSSGDWTLTHINDGNVALTDQPEKKIQL